MKNLCFKLTSEEFFSGVGMYLWNISKFKFEKGVSYKVVVSVGNISMGGNSMNDNSIDDNDNVFYSEIFLNNIEYRNSNSLYSDRFYDFYSNNFDEYELNFLYNSYDEYNIFLGLYSDVKDYLEECFDFSYFPDKNYILSKEEGLMLDDSIYFLIYKK